MRLLVTETLDPDGAMARWASPDLAALGHDVLPLPTQELVSLLGPHGLEALVLAIAREWRPDVILLCPPYDHLGRRALATLAELDVRPIAFAFDEPLFRSTAARIEGLKSYSHLFICDERAACDLRAAGLPASTLRWAASPGAFEASSAAAEPLLADKVLLVGRPYARRVALVAALAAEGLPLVVHGHGWAVHEAALRGVELGGPLTGHAMHTALAHAGAVITTGDWEDEPVPMVKYRLLEAAFCGARQVVQASPDLRAYFSADEVPDYRDPSELAAALRMILADPATAARRAHRARERALAEHTWAMRWGEVLATLALPARAARPRAVPAAYIAALAMLAHDAERRGADRLAEAAFMQWIALQADATAEAGLARLARRTADHARVVHHAGRACALWSADRHASDGLEATLPSGGGLGLVGFLDPRGEHLALELEALIATDPAQARARMAQAAAELPEAFVAAAAVLRPDSEEDGWRALFAHALRIAPLHAHAARWREVVNRPC